MQVIICGAGRVGQGIASHLSKEHHDITMVDENAALIDKVQTDFDVRGIIGDAAHPDVLERAGAESADMLIAVTHYDEINMVICQVADILFSVPTKIARIRSQAYLGRQKDKLFAKSGFPIDLVISPEIEVGEAILRRIRSPNSVSTVTFDTGNLQLLGLSVLPDSPLLETALDQIAPLFPDLPARIVGIRRSEAIFTPRGNDQLQVGDTAYVAVDQDHTSRIYKLFNHDNAQMRRVVIVGGGNIGIYIARALEKQKDMRVRIIEASPDQADLAVSTLRQTIVINGDGLSRDILEEAGAATCDILVAVTNDDKTNILICKLAKQIGAARTHALVNATELVTISKDLSIDAVLDPRALSVSKILTKLRRGRILSVQSIEGGTAEIAEGVTLETSPLIGKPIGYGDMADGISVAGLFRDGVFKTASNDLKVETGDQLVVFYEASATRKVEQFFRVSSDFF